MQVYCQPMMLYRNLQERQRAQVRIHAGSDHTFAEITSHNENIADARAVRMSKGKTSAQYVPNRTAWTLCKPLRSVQARFLQRTLGLPREGDC